MPSVILNDTSPLLSLDPDWGTGTPSANITGGFLYYSNNPETVLTRDIADRGKWLSRHTCYGSGQLYTWHSNNVDIGGGTIISTILVYNPSSTDSITITSSNYGTTNAVGPSDATAWVNYLNTTTPLSLTLGPGQYGNMFPMVVDYNAHFGVVARLNITITGTSTPASAVIWDLAYQTNSGGATAQADPVTSRQSGYSSIGSYNYLNFPSVSPTTNDGLMYHFGYNTDSFGGSDLVDVTGNVSGKVEGSYGSQFNVTIPVHNSFSTPRTFRVFLGSTGGPSFPVVNGYAGVIAKREWVTPHYSVDLIDATINPGATETINFTLMMAAMSASPYIFGARVL